MTESWRKFPNRSPKVDSSDELADVYAKAYRDWLMGRKEQKERPEIPEGLGRLKAQMIRYRIRDQISS
uniref:Uncharacterized protein n=1 Tax=viral metagenome TaxID=1070528 RepID=A0A6H1Z9N1_9ZZZZ